MKSVHVSNNCTKGLSTINLAKPVLEAFEFPSSDIFDQNQAIFNLILPAANSIQTNLQVKS